MPATKDFENPKVILKKKLLKEFHSKLIDPRSPTIHIDRTPIVFEESNHENNNDENDMDKSINLEDTFSDLFVDKKTEDIHVASSSSSKSLLLNDDSKNEIINNKENINVKDPRSPSFDVERTPIIFSDDSNDENEMIENFLDVLNTDKMTYNENSESMLVKIIRKGIVESIYTDNTINSMMKCSTPKRNDEQQSQQQQQQNKVLSKRTPLSCMGNISHNIKNKNNDKQIKPVKFNFNNLATMKHSKVEDNATPEN